MSLFIISNGKSSGFLSIIKIISLFFCSAGPFFSFLCLSASERGSFLNENSCERIQRHACPLLSEAE